LIELSVGKQIKTFHEYQRGLLSLDGRGGVRVRTCFGNRPSRVGTYRESIPLLHYAFPRGSVGTSCLCARPRPVQNTRVQCFVFAHSTVSSIRHRLSLLSSIQHPASSIQHRPSLLSSIQHPVSSIQYRLSLLSSIQHPVSSIVLRFYPASSIVLRFYPASSIVFRFYPVSCTSKPMGSICQKLRSYC